MSDATPERDPDAEPISSAAGALESHAGELGADADSAGVWAPGEHATLGLETFAGWTPPEPYRAESSAAAAGARGVDALLPAQLGGAKSSAGYRHEATIGDDERVRVFETLKYPWRALCQLRIHAKNGDEFIGTGWLIGPRTVVTAGHCVYLPEIGGWAEQVVVSPARNGRDRPFSSIVATRFDSVRGWTLRGKREHDYAVITLPEDQALHDHGCLGYASYETPTLLGSYLNLAGYPQDKDEGTTLWWSARRGSEVTDTVIYYDADTAEGQSGSPVWRLDPRSGQRVVVGIHTNGARTGNSAVRITPSVFRNLRRWARKSAT